MKKTKKLFGIKLDKVSPAKKQGYVDTDFVNAPIYSFLTIVVLFALAFVFVGSFFEF